MHIITYLLCLYVDNDLLAKQSKGIKAKKQGGVTKAVATRKLTDAQKKEVSEIS